MTIDEFNERISEMAMARMGLERYCGYLRHETRDKYLREEYTDDRTLIVAFDGDYSFEEEVVRGWWRSFADRLLGERSGRSS